MLKAYGYNLPVGYAPVEIVNLRVVARGALPKPDLPKIDRHGPLADARKPSRQVWFKDVGFVETSIYQREALPVGAVFEGPAIIEQADTTTVMPPRTSCKVDEYGNLVITVER